MADRTKLTLEQLRKLAREHLGAGYSKLTRSELFDALRKAAPKALKAAEAPEEKAPATKSAATRRVSMAQVESDIEELRSSTLKKKASEEPVRKGGKPVTARVTAQAERTAAPAEKSKPIARGVARVKSAIATIAKEVEARRQALKEEAAETKTGRAKAKTPLATAAVKARGKAAEETAPVKGRGKAVEVPEETAPVKTRAKATEEAEETAPVKTRAKATEAAEETAPAKTRVKATEAAKETAPVETRAKAAEVAEPARVKARETADRPAEVAQAKVSAKPETAPQNAPPTDAQKTAAARMIAPDAAAEAARSGAPQAPARAQTRESAPAHHEPAPVTSAPVSSAPEAPALRAAAETTRPPDPAALHAIPAPPRLAARPRAKVIARATLEAFPAVMAARMQAQRDTFTKLSANAGGTWSPEPQGPIAVTPPKRAHPANGGSEPITEGFFVARVAGRAEARLHHLTDDFRELGPYEGRPTLLGAGGHRIYVLPRDPGSLFLYWDVRSSQITLHEGEHIVVRVMERDRTLRELDPASLSRGYYVDGLKPGATYHVEAVGVSTGGAERDLDVTSSSVTLPSLGEEAERVRFLRVPFGTPLPRLRDFLRGGATRLTEREGAVKVTVPAGTWRAEGITNWDPGLSGSGIGRRWVREGDLTAQQRVSEWEESAEGRGLQGADRRGHELSGAGRPTSSFSLSGWGRGV